MIGFFVVQSKISKTQNDIYVRVVVWLSPLRLRLLLLFPGFTARLLKLLSRAEQNRSQEQPGVELKIKVMTFRPVFTYPSRHTTPF